MGTSGLYGFRMNGMDKTTYSHQDSYPTGLGQAMSHFIQNTTVDEMKDIFNKIQLVKEHGNSLPSEQDYLEWKRTEGAKGYMFSWYDYLRKHQGSLDAYKNGLTYMIDNREFIKDSLFCEWAYIINLDTNQFEVYKGFQTSPSNSRYGNKKMGKYYPCRLVATYSLDDVPSDWEAFEEAWYKCDELAY